MRSSSVLVVGAGPTGLMTACTLLRFGVPCRVVDRRHGPGGEPKALILWSGALEALRRTGVSDALVRQALPLSGATYWSRRRQIGALRFGGLTGTAFPRPLCLPQPVTEQALLERFTALGGQVEWGVEATDARQGDDEIVVELRDATGQLERHTVAWLVGADGIHSSIRPAVDIPFEGRTYDRVFLLGDGVVEGDTPSDEAQYHLTPDGVLVLVPLPGRGHRVFFDVAPGPETAPPDDALLQRLLDARGPGELRIRETWWTSRFRVHAKVASRFRDGRVFLAGDAAHCHSPAGGQGLNTGVQDGFDLGWKLAAVLRGADPALLDSYEAERRPASVRAVHNAHRQTRLWLLRSPVGKALRDAAMRRLSRRGVLERRLVPQLAQLDLDHAGSPAVADLVGAGTACPVPPGRRMPDAVLRPRHGTKATSLHEYLAAGRHTLVFFGDLDGRDVVQRAWHELVTRGAADVVDVLWVQPAIGTAAREHVEPTAGYDVAQEVGSLLSARPAWLGYVRPDGCLGVRAGVGQLSQVLDRLPSVSPARHAA